MKICIIYHNSILENFKQNQREKHKRNLELVARHINSNSNLKKKAVFVLASLLYIKENVYAATDPLNKVDIAGNTMLEIVRKIGYWICIIGCIIDIIKALLQGDTRVVAKIMMKYALAFSALYLFPWILDLIKSIFA